MNLAPKTELEAYELLLIMHLEGMLGSLRRLKPEHWDWTPDQAAPTPRTVAVHAWQWLMCDRQHIDEPDATKHSNVLEPPADCAEFCDAFQLEIENWRRLLRDLTPEDLSQPRQQFGFTEVEMNVRFFIGHMVQNVIYKHGQFSEVYFALGYDGVEPYSAPFPNAIYEKVRQAAEQSAS
jgi:hypothetical protein